MVRKIIKIDEAKCNGCGLCVNACHEDAIGLIDGKATLLRDDYCDGLGNCLPACPTGAITFEEREALAYDDAAVKAAQAAKRAQAESAEAAPLPCGCPGTNAKRIERTAVQAAPQAANSIPDGMGSRLNQWPVQIQLVPVQAPYFQGAKLLIAADCTAYAYGNFHNEFMKGRVTIIGCPKLDAVEYEEKLTEILKLNDIKSVQIVRMEVPCCSGLAHAAMNALKNCGKLIPWGVTIISTDGEIIEQ